MVQLSTPWVTPNRGLGPPVRRFLSNYFDLLLLIDFVVLNEICSSYLLTRIEF